MDSGHRNAKGEKAAHSVRVVLLTVVGFWLLTAAVTVFSWMQAHSHSSYWWMPSAFVGFLAIVWTIVYLRLRQRLQVPPFVD